MRGADRVLLDNGDDLIFETQDQLRTLLDYVFSPQSPWTPPPRNNGRTTAHRERYCLRYFLDREAARFTYPIAVEKTERPDFVITDKTGRRIGVEHTDAGSEAFQRWLSQTENGAPPVENVPDTPETSGAGPKTHLFDRAATEVVRALEHKTASINKHGYQDADEYVLLIYVLSTVPVLYDGDIDEILARLPALESVPATPDAGEASLKTFDRALIIVDGETRFWG